METFCSLWDVETGNSLGTYSTEPEALTAVLEVIAVNGTGFADARIEPPQPGRSMRGDCRRHRPRAAR